MEPDARARAIEDAAYKVLAEKGFKGTSMLAVAKAARASNETMYRWYGDKIGLFSAMIARNAEVVTEDLQRVRTGGGAGWDALDQTGRALLGMVTSDRAVALNRAAAADVSGVLGQALAEGGRGRVAPMIQALIADVSDSAADVAVRADVFISLLIGDLQIRRAIGVLEALSEEDVTARADRAMTLYRKLYDA